MADGRNVQKARDAELWLGGLRLSRIASSISVPQSWVQVKTSTLDSEVSRNDEDLEGCVVLSVHLSYFRDSP